jgi:hypothetical protein
MVELWLHFTLHLHFNTPDHRQARLLPSTPSKRDRLLETCFSLRPLRPHRTARAGSFHPRPRRMIGGRGMGAAWWVGGRRVQSGGCVCEDEYGLHGPCVSPRPSSVLLAV